MGDFEVHHFLRCHSKSDSDSADVSTQVWFAAFEPSKKSHLVATCGGNKVCVIDAETGKVQFRYTYLKMQCHYCNHRDMMLPTIADEIQRFARKHETRLDHHVNPLAIQLLDNSKDIRRLKRLKPYDLV